MADLIDVAAGAVDRSRIGRELLADIREIREELRLASPLAGGRKSRTGLRMMGSVPNNVMTAIEALYPEESKHPEFWRWFFKKYPQFSVR